MIAPLDAAIMYIEKPNEYKKKLSEYVQKYATEEALQAEATESKTIPLPFRD